MALLSATVYAPIAAAGPVDPFDGVAPVDIGVGNGGEKVGEAFFAAVDGVLHVRLTLDDSVSYDEAHLCLSAVPFTERIPPGLCPWKITQGDEGVFPAIELDGERPGLYAQMHVALSGGGSAYAGHQVAERGPFYGNVEVKEATTPGGTGTEDDEPSTSNDDDSDDPGTGTGEGGGSGTGSTPPAGNPGPVVPAPEGGSSDTTPETPEVTEAELPPLPAPPRSGDAPAGADHPVVEAGPGPVVPGEGVTTVIDPVSIARTAPPAGDGAAPPATVERTTEVLGSQLFRDSGRGSLPRTGAEAHQLLLIASGLLLAGAGLVLVGRDERSVA